MTHWDHGSEFRDQSKPKVAPVSRPAVAWAPTPAPALLVFAALASFVAPSGLPAQQPNPWEQIPIPPLHAFHPQQPKRIELKNGIVIFLQEDHELPFVYGSVVIRGGSRDEAPAKAGLVALYSQAWRTGGTAKMDGDAMDDLLESKAAHIETAGDVDSTALSWDSLKVDSGQVFSLAMDLLFHPRFSEQKLELAQQLEATAIVRRNDDEGGIAERESAKLVYGVNSPYARQPELATIRAVTLADLQAWHDRTLKGKLIIGISGDFDSAIMEAKVRAVFEGLPPVTTEPPRHDAFAGPKPGVYFIDKEDVDQSNVQIVGLGIERSNPDAATIVVLNEILGGGFGSRLFQTVRTKLGLAYAVGGGLGLEFDHPASFDVEVLTKSASTVDATRAAEGEIAGLVTKPFTEAELARAKGDILNSFLFSYDTREKILVERVRLEFYGYPADYLETYHAAIEKVTLADVTAVAKKYIHPEKLAILVVGNGPEINPDLNALNLGAPTPIDITIPRSDGAHSAGRAAE
ncbi:Peptidase M16 domain protein [Candidatus Sulfotelmatomonas gaucii]|uniref:Peptidase M16 domain protein n=1 Tax=Candidatus Sulfuritelmatomonas gaucii TaxID=2043161 RepID=A0A2N9M3P5_9BACT|nr:Peptidase M16 domain protein [Candidatus Sulfotelmatomonas gaucii]